MLAVVKNRLEEKKKDKVLVLFCFARDNPFAPMSRSQLPSVEYVAVDYKSMIGGYRTLSVMNSVKYAGEATIESKTTAKKRTLEFELRSRTSLGSDICELVAFCRVSGSERGVERQCRSSCTRSTSEGAHACSAP